MLLAVVALCALGIAEDPYRGSRLEKAALKHGYVTKSVVPWAGRWAVIEQGKRGFSASVIVEDGRRLSRLGRLGPWPADRLERVETVELVAGTPSLLLVLSQDAPDEVTHHVQVFASEANGLARLFDRTFILPKRRTDDSVVHLGRGEPHYRLRPIEGGAELVWVRRPRMLGVPRGDTLVRFAIGAEASIFRMQEGRLTEVESNAYEDFIPAHPVSGARATQQLPKIWGTAQAFWATDGDLQTSWAVPAAKQWEDATLTIQLAEAADVRMVRVVPGCAIDATTWASEDEVGVFRLDLGGTLTVDIDRSAPKRVPAGVEAWGEYPLSEGYGRQVVVFLNPPRRVAWARMTVLAPLRRVPKATEACISEISFH